MSWASRRRATYVGGMVLFFALLIGLPILHYISTIQPTCFDGIQNQGETAVDEGGPCLKLDPNQLSPWSIVWARSFQVRDGLYTAVTYIENPNSGAGVALAHYRFGLYDSGNVLVAEREGTTYIMPGGITPVLEAGIDTGNRVVVHTYFQITDQTLVWERMTNTASAIRINNQEVSDVDTMPRISARAQNIGFAPLHAVSFIAVVFDPNGNAFAASATAIRDLDPNSPQQITFTWPQPYPAQVGRVDIIALLPPKEAPLKSAP
jgi:hypothetical protein